jgi:DNA-binding GntR family transcriptional regulator
MSAVVEVSKSQRAYQWIRDRITSGAYTPGYRLVLSALAGELSMSVVPVREAVRALTAEGLVTFEHNVGARVAMVDASQYRDAMQVISVVESAATALASPYLTADDLARARELNEMMRGRLRDLDPRLFGALNQELHHTLYAKCPNPRLLEIVEAEWSRLRHLRDSVFTFVPGRAPHSVEEHDALIDMIEAGAPPEEVELAVRKHRSGTLSAFLTNRHDEVGPDHRQLIEGA